MKTSKKRPAFLTFLLWYDIITSPMAFTANYNQPWIDSVKNNIDSEYIPHFIMLFIILSIMGAVFSVAVLKWKKWGAWGLLLTLIISTSLALLVINFKYSLFSILFLGAVVIMLRKVWHDLN